MSLLILLLQNDQELQAWAECQKHYLSPGMPCSLPGWEGMSVPLSLYLCLFIGFFLIFLFVKDAFSREASISADEFKEATSRVLYRGSLLTVRHDEELWWLCCVISSDLIRVTEYINREVSRCFYQTGTMEDEEKIVAMLELLRISRLHSGVPDS